MTHPILLAAGGTGGHIWPALSFGAWIKKNKPDVPVRYICGTRELEREIYRFANEEPYVLDMEGSPLSGTSPIKRMVRLKSLFKSYALAKDIIRELNPGFCILFAGYISLPVLFACRALKVPVFLHEQNACAGKVTRFAAMTGVSVFSGWKDCKGLSPSKYTPVGVPVRNFKMTAPFVAWRELGLPGNIPYGPKVMVFGGSLGSKGVKDAVCQIAGDKEYSSWTFIVPAVSQKAEKAADNVFLLPKIWNTSLLFSIADMALVRAGGSTLTEIGTLGIPALVVPWRKAADDHQFYNAVAYFSENKSIIWDGEGGLEEFKKKLTNLYAIYRYSSKKTSYTLYNSADRICENLWLAIFSDFEGSAYCGTE